jgi:hypothetical protein
LGWLEQAADAASQAIALDRSLPEAHYNLAVIDLTEALSTADEDEQWRSALIIQANRHALTTLALDPAFFDAMDLIATTQAMQGDCDTASETIQNARGPHPGMHRKYPIETGTGDMHSASIGRRRHIRDLPGALRPEYCLASCESLGV